MKSQNLRVAIRYHGKKLKTYFNSHLFSKTLVHSWQMCSWVFSFSDRLVGVLTISADVVDGDEGSEDDVAVRAG